VQREHLQLLIDGRDGFFMKKLISLLLIAALAITSMVCAYAADSGPQVLNPNELDQYNFSSEITEMIQTQIENGGQVYYGQGTTTPDYLNENTNSRAIPTDIVNLPYFSWVDFSSVPPFQQLVVTIGYNILFYIFLSMFLTIAYKTICRVINIIF